ncbi:hypothetical protein G5V57_26010 [Nordella sp. HKS 07]|uniref:hypothetical protein n=1 Tax=Nordella sp. HKS 07 TaxID=2712222 RepID=UPI0013E18940|nr:hypothetical protein [Nordella sp. HKS 07]QIG50883.1 hypothetical protein G5V57_26010 [Nordella sp. HKS 07]
MKSFKSTFAALALGTAVAVTGLAGADMSGTFSAAVARAAQNQAAGDLRLTLNGLLSEHVTLAAAATQAALRGRKSEFEAAAAALDMNSQDIAGAIGSVYGQEAGEAFLPLWRKHIGFFVDYTMGKAIGSKKKQDKAVNDLVQYASDFGAFLNSATPALPKDTVADLVKMHVVSLKEVVDAQAARDYKLAFEKTRAASHHMRMIADPLADAIAAQFPDKFAAK